MTVSVIVTFWKQKLDQPRDKRIRRLDSNVSKATAVYNAEKQASKVSTSPKFVASVRDIEFFVFPDNYRLSRIVKQVYWNFMNKPFVHMKFIAQIKRKNNLTSDLVLSVIDYQRHFQTNFLQNYFIKLEKNDIKRPNSSRHSK